MRKLTILFLLILAGTVLKAQDIIITKKGDEAKVKVTKVTPTEIEYQMYDNGELSDVLYTIAKSDVFMIKYKGGRKEIFTEENNTEEKTKVVEAPTTVKSTAKGQKPIKTDVNSFTQKPIEQPVSKYDRFYLHNGTIIDGTLIKVDNYTIIYTYQDETAEQVISKYAIEKITHSSSGRVEKITDKIVVEGKWDWDKVVFLEDKSYATGLTKVDEIQGHTARFSYTSLSDKDIKATKKLKEAAAEMGCPFILLTGAITSVYQGVRKGIGYKY